MQGYPRSPAPALPLENMGSIGKAYGIQSSEQWQAGESDNRQIIDARLPVKMWRVSLFGSEWMRFNILYGSSRGIDIKGLQGPVVFYSPGQIAVYAEPAQAGQLGFLAGYAYGTLTAVNNAGVTIARKQIGGAQAIPDNAARFVALDNASILLGTSGTLINLTQGQTLSLTAGSRLTGGDGFLEFEP